MEQVAGIESVAGSAALRRAARDRGTRTRATRILGVVVLALMALLVLLGLVISNADVDKGDTVRLLYLHVPSAEMAYVAFAVGSACSLLYLVRRTRSMTWDRIANASVELGVLFTGLMLVTGSLWGRLTWGQFWAWDARVTSSALLFVMFVGYLAVRRLEGSPEQTARRSAVVCLVAMADVPLVHFSVDWFRTVHQRPTFTFKGSNIEGIFRFTHFVGFTAFFLAYVWMLMHRNRVAMLEQAAEQHEIAAAIAERQREGATHLSGAGAGAGAASGAGATS